MDLKEYNSNKKYWMDLFNDYFGKPKGRNPLWKAIEWHYLTDTVWYQYEDYAIALEIFHVPVISFIYKPFSKRPEMAHLNLTFKRDVNNLPIIMNAIIHPENTALCVGIPEFADILRASLKDLELGKV